MSEVSARTLWKELTPGETSAALQHVAKEAPLQLGDTGCSQCPGQARAGVSSHACSATNRTGGMT